MKNRSFSIIALILMTLNACQEKNDITVSAITGDAIEVTTTSATLTGSIFLSEEITVPLQVWFQIATESSQVLLSGKRVKATNGLNDRELFSVTVSNLEPGTTYYYVMVVSSSGKESVGKVLSFTTASKPKELIVTSDASFITQTTAQLSGYANLENVSGVARFGIILSTSENPSKENGTTITTNEIDSSNKYSVSASSLIPATKYYYKAFVESEGVSRVGEIKTFTTKDFTVSINTVDASDVGMFTSTLHGNIKVQSDDKLITETWFLYGNDSSLESLKKNGTRVGAETAEDGSFVKEIKDLTNGTGYYFVACSKVSNREYYGNVLSFETKGFSAECSLLDNIEIGLFDATFFGKLVIDSSESLSKTVTVYYSKTDTTKDSIIKYGDSFVVSKTFWESEQDFRVNLQELDYNTTYFCIAVAEILDKKFYSAIKTITTQSFPEIVDLGLSVKWRGWNVGANRAEDYGNYYAWGETATKTSYTYDNYNKELLDLVNSASTLSSENDAASVNLGSRWRIPSNNEATELVTKCTVKRMTVNGINGYLITGPNQNSIFVPGSGYIEGTEKKNYRELFWLNYPTRSSDAHYMRYNSRLEIDDGHIIHKYCGLTVRPVTD